MSTYAAKTEVPVERSRAEIERTLQRYGATSFAYGWDQTGAVVQFEAAGRRVRFVLPLPDRNDPAFTTCWRGEYGSVHWRTQEAAQKLWEQACRQRWRALLLVIKAKLEAVEVGITTFEDEFLAHICLPQGGTVGEWARVEVARVYELGTALPALGPGGES